AVAGKLDDWLTDSSSGLALLILLDQFPRNMFRGSAKAFASDARARRNASLMIERDLDLALPPERRHFVYLPFMHSEDPADQDRCIKFIRERMAENGEENLLHARAHKEIIHRFGRFPYRNQALGRINTREEDDWLKGGGYGAIVNEIRNADACPPDAVTDP
ncbi:MAG: DUF924 domain-containing protein, partial [Rhodobacteraceae bacterium]|nr:DUF924 domain-containing protein [Paracoccaceae bacterium]